MFLGMLCGKWTSSYFYKLIPPDKIMDSSGDVCEQLAQIMVFPF